MREVLNELNEWSRDGEEIAGERRVVEVAERERGLELDERCPRCRPVEPERRPCLQRERAPLHLSYLNARGSACSGRGRVEGETLVADRGAQVDASRFQPLIATI